MDYGLLDPDSYYESVLRRNPDMATELAAQNIVFVRLVQDIKTDYIKRLDKLRTEHSKSVAREVITYVENTLRHESLTKEEQAKMILRLSSPRYINMAYDFAIKDSIECPVLRLASSIIQRTEDCRNALTRMKCDVGKKLLYWDSVFQTPWAHSKIMRAISEDASS